MPEANYLLSVSWGYIKVCDTYYIAYRDIHFSSLCHVTLMVCSKEM